MSENGAAYAAALTIQHLLRSLEAKGVLPSAEIREMRDAVSNALGEAGTRGALLPEAAITASRTLEMMFLPLSDSPRAEPEAIPTEELNASNDE